MKAHWATEEAIQKSLKASQSRNSSRGGLGPHKHCSGPKSHERIQEEMEIEEGREVSIGEVFIKTHTKKDGTIVDEKAKMVRECYEQKLETTLSQLDASVTSDGASNSPQLTLEQKNAIFLESTVVDSRGTLYGIGRLAKTHGKGKTSTRRIDTKSPAIVELEEKLHEALLKIQEQAQYNQLMFEYLKIKDPELPQWLEGNRARQPSVPPTLPLNTPQTESCSTPIEP